MFKKIKRRFFKNPFLKVIEKAKRRGGRTFLIAWNRGLGDIPLGLFAVVQKIKEEIEDAHITFLTRDGLLAGFSMLEGVSAIGVKSWSRGKNYSIRRSLKEAGVLKRFDIIIKRPDPAYWVKWQIGKVVPRLFFDPKYDDLYKKFSLEDGKVYIGVQTESSTEHSPWRDWPRERWEELFLRLEREKEVRIVIFGVGGDRFQNGNVIDLRGRTSLFEMLSVIKGRCSYMILPDGGILSVLYYLDRSFPIEVISLWNDCQGVLKQGVGSPNPGLVHFPIFDRDISVDMVLERLYGDRGIVKRK